MIQDGHNCKQQIALKGDLLFTIMFIFLMLHRWFQATSFPRALFAMAFAVSIAYDGRFLPTAPVSDGTPKKCNRNAEIRARHQQGELVATLAEVFGISEQRVSQILHGRRK